MAKIQLTLPVGEPIADGKQISFKSPDACQDVSALIIDGVEYALVDYKNNVLSESFEKDSIISVIVDTVNLRACIQNAGGGGGGSGPVDIEVAKLVYGPSGDTIDVDLTTCTTIEEDLWGERSGHVYPKKLESEGLSSFSIDVLGYVDIVATSDANPAVIVINNKRYEFGSEVFQYSGKVECPIQVILTGIVGSLEPTMTFETFTLIPGKVMTSTEGLMPKNSLKVVHEAEKFLYTGMLNDSNIGVGADNFAIGSGNKVGSHGYPIVGYTGVNGSSGEYKLKGTSADAATITQLLLAGEKLVITIELRSKMNCDGWCRITDAWYNGDDTFSILVDNFYSNINSSETVSYDSEASYKTVGYPYSYAPELGYAVKEGTVAIYIHNHPELGFVIWREDAAAIGLDNIVQGDYALAQGKENRIYGRYASGFGKGIKAGYNCHGFGRNLNMENAQECVSMGLNNTIDNLATGVIQNGMGLVAHNSYAAQFGKFNNPKARNILELGNGNNESDRKNVFEVDREGYIYSNEKYVDGQCLISSVDTTNLLIGNLVTQPFNTSRNNSDKQIESTATELNKTTTSSWYTCYISANAKNLHLSQGCWYCLSYELTIHDCTDVNKLDMRGYTKNLSTNAETPTGEAYKNQLKLGKNIVHYVFCADSTQKAYGTYLNYASGLTTTWSIDNPRVYQLHPLMHFTSTDFVDVYSTLPVKSDERRKYAVNAADPSKCIYRVNYSYYFSYDEADAQAPIMLYAGGAIHNDHMHKDASYERVTKSIDLTTCTYGQANSSGNEPTITSNSISGADSYCHVFGMSGGIVKIKGKATGNVHMYVDGAETQIGWVGGSTDVTQEVYVEHTLGFNVSAATIEFDVFQVTRTEYTDGHISGKRLEELETTIAKLTEAIKKHGITL